MARLAPFRLHDWLVEHEAEARLSIAGSGIPPTALADFIPETADGWQRWWSTRPAAAVAGLKQALADVYGLPAEEFTITQGASEADFLATLALAGPGGAVAVEKPAYHALLAPAVALGCDVRRIARRASDGFRLSPEACARALDRPTRLTLLARPNNPTGERIPDSDLEDLAGLARRRRGHLLVDEVFAEATSAGDHAARHLHPSILSVNSITKTLGFGAMHVGWIAAPKALGARLHLAKDTIRPLNPVLPVLIAMAVVAHRERLLRVTRERRRGNLTLMAKWLRDTPHIEGALPEHGTTMVVRLPPRLRNDVAFARRLLKSSGVLVVPGTYVELPGWLRIGLLTDPATLAKGLEALSSAVS